MPQRSRPSRFSSARLFVRSACVVLLLSLLSPSTIVGRRVNPAAPVSLQVLLSNNLAAPGGTITVTPIVRDENGVIINDPNFQFSIHINANGIVVGNPPLVEGRTISFPKVIKQLINPNPEIDPQGEYADANPSDPNYGLETGGFYRVTATLVGTPLSGSADVTVLPTGTAKITVRTKQYADEMASALGAMTNALNQYDQEAVAAARASLQAIANNTDNSHEVLSVNDLLAPPNGYPVTPSQLIAAGFLPGAGDNRLPSLIDEMQGHISGGRTRLAQLNPARLTRRDVIDLWAIIRRCEELLQEFSTLAISPLGVIQHGEKLNKLITSEMPLLLDSIKLKALALAAAVPATAKAWLMQSFWASVKLIPAVFAAGRGLASIAQATILIGTITAANSIANVVGARLVNSRSPGGILLEYLGASSSQIHVCPHYPNTFIGGSGLTSNPQKIKILLIGCVDSPAISVLLLLRIGLVRDIKAGLLLIAKIISSARALWNSQIAAVVHPADYVITDYLWDYTVYYTNGWPRVNQGLLPCVGTIVVFNMEDATHVAANSIFLPHCGS